MAEIKTLKDLRAALKPLGYGIKTKRLSWGPHAIYTRPEGGHELTYNVFTAETLAVWTPLFDFLREHGAELKAIHETEKIYGLLWAKR